jgi:hypothetical protein
MYNMRMTEQTTGTRTPNEGRIARVTFQDDRVILTPSMGSNPDRLNRKVQNEKKFNDITTGIPGLHQLKVLYEDQQSGRYEVERAPGFNLTSIRSQVQGGGMVDFFHIPIPFKANAMLTYLKVIDVVNSAGYCFVDHKSDSVFIDPQRKQISIADVDALTEQKNGAFQREIQGGLQDVLKSFFTRGIKKDPWTLIPAGPTIVTSNLENYKSAHEAVLVLEGWVRGEKTISYSGDEPSGPKRHFELLTRSLKSSEMEAKIQSIDYEHITDYQRDIFEAEIYTALLFKSEEPQAIDRFCLGIKK